MGAHFRHLSRTFQILLASLLYSGCCFLRSFWRLTPSSPRGSCWHLTIALASNPHANDFLFTPWGPLTAYVCVAQEDGRLNVLWSTALTTRWINSATLAIPPLYMVLRWGTILQGYVISCTQILVARECSSCWLCLPLPSVPLALTSASWVCIF